MQAFDAPGNKKPGELSSTGLLVVDKVIEISNLDLFRDLKKVTDSRGQHYFDCIQQAE
jgi:hypothetical protein